MRLKTLLFLTLFTAWSALAQNPDKLMSQQEFAALTGELSQKVSLFRDAWKENPKAEFFGGTSRDFVYWVKRQFIGVDTPEQARKKVAELRSRSIIQPKEFLSQDSDVDIVSDRSLSLNKDTYGLKKIDYIRSDRFDISTAMGKSEINQGYLPIEKIRIGSQGIVQSTTFGDGVDEIFRGRPTMHVTPHEIFDKTHYAKSKANHQVLLALRYLRSLSIDYYNSHGQDRPDPTTAFQFDPQSEAGAKRIIEQAKDELTPYFANAQFKKYFNDTVTKSFRSYINPTATLLLYQRFGLDRLISRYSEATPINQYLFATYRNPDVVAENMKLHQTDPEKLYVPPSQEFPDGKLYHGTKEEQFFRSILFGGIFPSNNGSAGAGLYSVRSDNIPFATNWGGSVDRVVEFEIKPNAKVIDITHGEGQRVFNQFLGRWDQQGDAYSAFADAFDADILRYPYNTRAYVIKNSAVLSKPNGYTRKLLSLEELITQAKEAKSIEDLKKLDQAIQLNLATADEVGEVWRKAAPIEGFVHFSALENASKGASYIPDGLNEKLYTFMIELRSLSEKPTLEETEVRAFQQKFREIMKTLALIPKEHQKSAMEKIAANMLHVGIDQIQSIEHHLFDKNNAKKLTKETLMLELKLNFPRLLMAALHGGATVMGWNDPHHTAFEANLFLLLPDFMISLGFDDMTTRARSRLPQIREEKHLDKLAKAFLEAIREEHLKQTPLAPRTETASDGCASSVMARLRVLLN